MTKLLDKAIARVRNWPEERQDEAARILLDMEREPYKLSDKERTAIEEARRHVEKEGIASDDDVRAMWTKHGL